METITKTIYKSNDGKEFDTEKECLEYESKSIFETWYSKNQLLINVPDDNGEFRCDIKYYEIFEWLIKYKKEIAKFLFHHDFSLLQELKNILDKPLDIDDSDDMANFIDDLEKLSDRYKKFF